MLAIIGQHFYWPQPRVAGSASTMTIDHALDFFGGTFTASESGTITDIHFRTGTVTTSQSITGGIYTIDAATGGPGTLVGTAGTLATVTSNTNHNFSGSLSASVTAGTRYCFKIAFTSTAGNVAIVQTVASFVYQGASLFPYRVTSTDNTGTLSKNAGGNMCAVSIECSGGVFHFLDGLSCSCGSGSVSLSSSGTIAVGLRFKPPMHLTSHGIWAGATFANGSACVLELYDDATAAGGTPLATASVDEDMMGSNSNGLGYWEFDGSAEVVLDPAAWYRVVIRNTNTTGATVYRQNNIPATAHLAQLFGTADCYATSYASGAWTDATTEAYFIGLIINKVHNNTGIGAASMSLGI